MQVWVMRFICLKFVFSPFKASSETNQKDVKLEEGRGSKYKSLFLSYDVLAHSCRCSSLSSQLKMVCIWFCIFRSCPSSTFELRVPKLAHHQKQTRGIMHHLSTTYNSVPHGGKVHFYFPAALSFLVRFYLCPQDIGALKLLLVLFQISFDCLFTLYNKP